MSFEGSVFVNCPLDEAYYPLLRPLLFTIIYAGLTPRIALERMDSGESRITKIAGLVCDSKYAIHDLSRIKAKKRGELYRLNMPFELGLDVGCRLFANDRRCDKKCLILETERYRYQAAISDLSGSDIAAHHDKPTEMVAQVRDWLNSEASGNLPGPSHVWAAFTDFTAWSYDVLRVRGFSRADIRRLPVSELVEEMKSWVAMQRQGTP